MITAKTPGPIKDWSLTSLKEHLMKIGHPSARLTGASSLSETPNRGNMRLKSTAIWGMPVSMLLGAAALLFIVAIGGCDQSGPQTPEQLQVEACHADWRKCRDNKEIVYTWAGGPGGITPRVTCEFAANDLAKYGTPEWPGFPAYSFNNFRAQAKAHWPRGILSLSKLKRDFRTLSAQWPMCG